MNTADVNQNLVELLLAAQDLSESVKEDLKRHNGYISEKTVLFLNDFRNREVQLNTILDILNGVN